MEKHAIDVAIDVSFIGAFDPQIRPFKQYVLEALKLYEKLDITLIAPLHGPILRTNPRYYLEQYSTWSSEAKFRKHLFGQKMLSVFYMSSYDNTQAMAKRVTQGADSVEGIVASMYDLSSLDEQNMIDLLEESDAIIVGSPTINGDAVKPAWDLLSCMAYLENRSKVGVAFGSYGWTGEAPEMLHDRMRWLKFRLPVAPLKVKLIPTSQELEECFAFGREIAEITMGKMQEIDL